MATTKTISPAKLAHVVLRTSPENFTPMKEFYKQFLGGHATYENQFLSFITYDDEHHRIAIGMMPGIEKSNAKTCGLELCTMFPSICRRYTILTIIQHIAFTFNALPDLLLSYRQRKTLGMTPVWCVNHGPTMSIYYRDPDGNQLETQIDCFETAEGATAFMDSSEFAENPFGVDFDPEELARKLEEGVSEKELLKRPDIGPRGMETVPLMME